MTSRRWLTGVALLAGVAAGGQAAAPRPPNLVLIVTDNQGAADRTIKLLKPLLTS